MRRLANVTILILILSACARTATTVPTEPVVPAFTETAAPPPVPTDTPTALPSTDALLPTLASTPAGLVTRDAYWVIGASADGQYLAYWERLKDDPHNVRLCIINTPDNHYCPDDVVVNDAFLRRNETVWSGIGYSIGFLKYNPNRTAVLVVYDAANQTTTEVGLHNNDAFRKNLRSYGFEWMYTGSSSDTNFCGVSRIFTTDGVSDPVILDDFNTPGTDFAEYQKGTYGYMVRGGCYGNWEYVLTVGFEDYPLGEIETDPLLSPEGDSVMYLINEGLIIQSPEAQDRWVVTHHWPDAKTWSLDGKYIAYDLYGDGVYLVRTDISADHAPVKIASLTEGHWLAFWNNYIVAYDGFSMTLIPIP